MSTDNNFFLSHVLFLVLDTVPAAAIGVGAGAIAAIVIGAVAFLGVTFFGGKKGYDAYLRLHNGMEKAQENPLYESNAIEAENPLYEDRATSSEMQNL